MIKLLTFNYWFNQMEKLIAAFKIFLLTSLRKSNICNVYITEIRKERFAAGKTKPVREASIRCYTSC